MKIIFSAFILFCLVSIGYAADQIYVGADEDGKTEVYQAKPEGWQDREYTLTGSKIIDPGHEQQRATTQQQQPLQVTDQHTQQHQEYLRQGERNREAAQRAYERRIDKLLDDYQRSTPTSSPATSTDKSDVWDLERKVRDLEFKSRMGW